MNVIQTFCYGAGAICLGIALTFLLITTLAARYNEPNGVEGCLSTVVVLLPLIIGLYLIVKAMIA